MLETGEDPRARATTARTTSAQVWEHIKNLRKRVAGFN